MSSKSNFYSKWLKRGGVLILGYCSYEGLYRGYCMLNFNIKMINEYENATLKQKQAFIFERQEALAFNFDYHMDIQEAKTQINKVRAQLLKDIKGKVLETHVGNFYHFLFSFYFIKHFN